MKVMDISDLKKEAKIFCEFMKKENHSSLIGVTDGKAVGTYVDTDFKTIFPVNMKLRLEAVPRELIYQERR